MSTICWFRRVLRLDDHPALVAAAGEGVVVPLVILDPEEAAAHPASAQRQVMSLPVLDAELRRRGSRLIVRRGRPDDVLGAVVREVGASSVHTTHGFPFSSDDGLEDAARQSGARLHLHPAADLVPRGSVRTGSGGVFRVYSPFFKALKQVPITAPLEAPELASPDDWPSSEGPDWPEARQAMRRGWDVVAAAVEPGEGPAMRRLVDFLDEPVTDYPVQRDEPWRTATSGLSDALAVGEISARRIWHTSLPAWRAGAPGVESFLSELAWREFARDLLAEAPTLGERCWRPEWESFPWDGDGESAELWRRGRTGVDMVDAGMRELFATGRMHNRVRMIAASYLTKHLLTDWRVGLAWFERTLTDWDPASNAMNWQWVAGCGPDASPYFRIFNPDTQATRFDPHGAYRRHWLSPSAEGARRFAAAAPVSWHVDLTERSEPTIALSDGRARALAAYESMRASQGS
ncbi:cryptochrome/photolyase family protein [Tessaracoccus sp. Z1128]